MTLVTPINIILRLRMQKMVDLTYVKMIEKELNIQLAMFEKDIFSSISIEGLKEFYQLHRVDNFFVIERNNVIGLFLTGQHLNFDRLKIGQFQHLKILSFVKCEIINLKKLKHLESLCTIFCKMDIDTILSFKDIKHLDMRLDFQSFKSGLSESIAKEIQNFKSLESLTFLPSHIKELHYHQSVQNLKLISSEYYELDITFVKMHKQIELLLIKQTLERFMVLKNVHKLILVDFEHEQLEHLGSFKDMKKLVIENTIIDDISLISHLVQIEELELRGCSITDISALSQMEKLKKLTLRYNQIEDILTLSKLKNLEYLDIRSNRISDISPLSHLTNLKELYVSYNEIKDISVLSNLTNLYSLGFNFNQVTNIDAVSKLERLKFLYLSMNQVTDITPLENLKELTILGINSNQIEPMTIVILEGLTNIQRLYIANNKLKNANFTIKLPKLKYINLSYNEIEDMPELKGIQVLKSAE